jgi:hypothetical protein
MPAATRRRFAVELRPPLGQKPTAVTVLVGYRSDRLGIPGSGGETAVRARLQPLAPDTRLTPNDLGYALRVVALSNQAFAPAPLFAVEFDTCRGAAAASAADLSCVVEGCASSGTPIRDCRCAVSAR